MLNLPFHVYLDGPPWEVCLGFDSVHATHYCAIGLQTDCVVTVVAGRRGALVVRLPDSPVYAVWLYATGCRPCNNNNTCAIQAAARKAYP